MRLLQRFGTLWHVTEVDSAQSPGARGGRCLVFDGETVVRRAWVYPDNWDSLSDDQLWHLLEAAPPPIRPTPPASRTWSASADHPTVVAATETAARIRARIADGSSRASDDAAIDAEREALLRTAQQEYEVMHAAIGAYTEQLKRAGLPPEHTLAKVKLAIQEGLGGPAGCDEPGGEELLADGVAWCIQAYYADDTADATPSSANG